MHSFLFQLKKRRTISGTRFLSHPASAQASPSTTDTRWLPETTSSLLFSYKEKWIHKLLPPPVMSKDGKAQDTPLLGWPTPQDTRASLSLRALGFPALSRVIRATRTIEICSPSNVQTDVVGGKQGHGLETTGVSLWRHMILVRFA